MTVHSPKEKEYIYKGSGGTGASYVIAHANVGSVENVFVINN